MKRLRLYTVFATIGLLAVLSGCGSDGVTTDTSQVGDPITVEQLLARSSDTPVAVQGLLHVERDVARLCAATLESYPPQCGEPSVELVGLDLLAVEGVSTVGGVSWKEGAVLNLERGADGRFTVDDVAAAARVQIILGLYSGLPDPSWTLTTEQASELADALEALNEVDDVAPAGGLGYRGFTIVSTDGSLQAYAGKVVNAGSERPFVRDDPDRTVERFLLDTARDHITAEEVQVVADALDQE